MSKRVISALSVLLLILNLFSVMGFADDAEPEDPIDPDEPYIDIYLYNCGCDIDSNGRAYASAYAQTYQSGDTIYISVDIQRYKNGAWSRYAGPWSSSGTGVAGVGKYYYVVPGYYYCSTSTVTVYDSDGHYVETRSLSSPSTWY